MKILRLLFLSSFMGAALPAVAAQPTNWKVDVDATIGKTRLRYTTHAWVYSPGPRYKATLYGIGPYKSVGNIPLVSRLDEVIKRESAAELVFNAGFWDAGPFSPAGLLLLNGTTLQNFWFARNERKDYNLSAVICLDRNGRLQALATAAFDNKTSDVKQRCYSAVQAGPFVVDKGENGITASEVTKSKTVRTILGFDSAGTPWVVIFRDPVNLFVAAEFLRADTGARGAASIRNAGKGGSALSNTGLGLWNAINLDGDVWGSAGFFRGQTIIGTPTMAMPSAFALSPR